MLLKIASIKPHSENISKDMMYWGCSNQGNLQLNQPLISSKVINGMRRMLNGIIYGGGRVLKE